MEDVERFRQALEYIAANARDDEMRTFASATLNEESDRTPEQRVALNKQRCEYCDGHGYELFGLLGSARIVADARWRKFDGDMIQIELGKVHAERFMKSVKRVSELADGEVAWSEPKEKPDFLQNKEARRIRFFVLRDIIDKIQAKKDEALEDFDPEDGYICALNGCMEIAESFFKVRLTPPKDSEDDLTVTTSKEALVCALLHRVGGAAAFTVNELSRADQQHLVLQGDGHKLQLRTIGNT